MKLKLFAERDSDEAEAKVNAWFTQKKSKAVISKTQIAVSNITDQSGGTSPYIVVAIWYSDVSN